MIERITPEHISSLQPGQIFVFGSNRFGHHAGGAARYALDHFGAEWGNGEGLQGRSYAIPTMEGLDSTRQAVQRFIAFAKAHPELTFLVTPIGCGIAGYTPNEIAPFFADARSLPNIYLPASFLESFEIKAPKEPIDGLAAFYALRDEARKNGAQDMTLDEINQEINKARAERKKKQ